MDTAKPPLALTVDAFCHQFGLGRTNVYAQIKAGKLRAVKAGGRTLIPYSAAEAWLNSLPPYVASGQAA